MARNGGARYVYRPQVVYLPRMKVDAVRARSEPRADADGELVEPAAAVAVVVDARGAAPHRTEAALRCAAAGLVPDGSRRRVVGSGEEQVVPEHVDRPDLVVYLRTRMNG